MEQIKTKHNANLVRVSKEMGKNAEVWRRQASKSCTIKSTHTKKEKRMARQITHVLRFPQKLYLRPNSLLITIEIKVTYNVTNFNL